MSEYSNSQKNGQGSGLKYSLGLLAIVAISAVIWVIFLADDRDLNDFTDLVENQVAEPTTENVIEAPQDDTPVIIPSFDVVRISSNGTGVIAGRAEPGSDVIIYAKEVQIGSAIADRNGEWVLLFDEPLPKGPTELSIVSKMQNQFEVASSDIVIVSVPDTVNDNFNVDDMEGVVAILSPRSGNGASRVLQKPQNVNMASATKGLSLDALDYTDNGKTVINGSAEAGANIRLYLDNEYLGDVVSGEDGTWKYEITKVLSSEEHVLRLDQILLDGNVEVRIRQPFNPYVALEKDRATGDVIVNPGNSLWHIARKLYGAGYHYTVIFGANIDIIDDPNLIYPGQSLSLPLAQMQ